MKKISLLLSAGLLGAVPLLSMAEEEAVHQVTANVAMTTDYLFRGLSQTDENPAIQGGIDYSYTPVGFYAGTWASNVAFAESSEFDFYAGLSGELGIGVSWDVGGLYYTYPGSSADPEENYFEVYTNLGYSFSKVQLEPSLSTGVFYSPDFFGEDGAGIYVYGGLDLSLPYDIGLSLLVGWQDVEGDMLTGPVGYDYTHYSIGLSRDVGPLSLSLSWNDADDACGGDLCEAVVFTVSSSF